MNEEFFDDYLSSPEIEPLDRFRALLSEASDRQLDEITVRLDKTEDLSKELVYEEGVEAKLIRCLGDELVLTALYHLFEKKIKEVILFRESSSEDVTLTRWDDFKKYIPTEIKGSSQFSEVNKLRLLVNCFKHSGLVDNSLYRVDQSFGDVDDHINADLDFLYDNFKKATIYVVRETYLLSKTQ